MGLLGINFKWPVWIRNKAGQNFYDITNFENWTNENDNLALSLTHPLLSPAVLFISKLFSQGEIKIVRQSTGKEIKDHKFIKLLNDPNYSQTLPDLLENLMYMQIARGVGILWGKKSFGSSTPNSLYVLDFALFEWPEEMKHKKYINRTAYKALGNIKISYDKYGEDLKIPLKDLLFFYDMPNGIDDKNVFNVVSRVEGLKQTLYNTKDSLIAKSIIIKSNGKEMITGVKDGFPLTPDEKEAVEKKFNNDYGLSRLRKRGLVTKASVKWQSMHIIMRDLGNDEGIQTDAAIIFAGLHLPNDIYSIKGSKSTYKNANQSLVSYLQNEMQATIESFCATINKAFFSDGIYKIKGSYSHLPVMLSYKTTEYESISAQAKALNDLLTTGVPEEIALEMCGFDKSITLEDIMPIGASQQNSGEEEISEEQEKALIRLITATIEDND